MAAKDYGWEYIGISDHSKSSYQANGMSEETILEQVKRIKQLNLMDDTFQIFSGVECDILKDGELDFSEEILKKLDFVIVSIHRYFNQEEIVMTKRLLKAIENPYTTMIGHLTGRLLRFRDPYQLNVSKIIDACIANNKIIELNSYPSRVDMDWRYWIKAKEKGLKCCINPDAHSTNELMNCKYGINMARKGWLEKKDVINTLPLNEMKLYLKSRSN
ncbi:MAG: PHP domain-containing protein [Parachlamydiaceae bacterium]|nr:PHP domain-containing protein [Parachlamydiaceae bacterium]